MVKNVFRKTTHMQRWTIGWNRQPGKRLRSGWWGALEVLGEEALSRRRAGWSDWLKGFGTGNQITECWHGGWSYLLTVVRANEVDGEVGLNEILTLSNKRFCQIKSVSSRVYFSEIKIKSEGGLSHFDSSWLTLQFLFFIPRYNNKSTYEIWDL